MDENKISENLENTENNEVSVVKKDENPNKITLFEIFVLFLLLICVALYISPNFLIKAETANMRKFRPMLQFLHQKL